ASRPRPASSDCGWQTDHRKLPNRVVRAESGLRFRIPEGNSLQRHTGHLVRVSEGKRQLHPREVPFLKEFEGAVYGFEIASLSGIARPLVRALEIKSRRNAP